MTMTKMPMTRAGIPNQTMDCGFDNKNGDECIDDNNNLWAITHRFGVVTLEKRWDIPSGVQFLGFADAIRVAGEGGESVGGSFSVFSSFLSVLLYRDASEAAIPWTNFTNSSWVLSIWWKMIDRLMLLKSLATQDRSDWRPPLQPLWLRGFTTVQRYHRIGMAGDNNDYDDDDKDNDNNDDPRNDSKYDNGMRRW